MSGAAQPPGAGAIGLLGLGLVDAAGVVGTALEAVAWRNPDDPLRSPRGFREVFDRADETYRRIDRISRALVLATEAAGLARAVPASARHDTAIVVESVSGCLDSDLHFAAGLAAGIVNGPLFPYTLPSTCMGEVALRHGLRGPTVGLSITPEQAGAALHEARALLLEGQASYALVGSVEVLRPWRPSLAPALCSIVALIGPSTGTAPNLDSRSTLEHWTETRLRAPVRIRVV